MKELDEFESWPKIARLNRDMVITEKIDGTNAQISIRPADWGPVDSDLDTYAGVGDEYVIRAGSRNKWIAQGKQDNAGFAGWVRTNAEVLVKTLGEGRHYGEWWGQGIQRKYGLDHKCFSLFNVHRWTEELIPDAIPVHSIDEAQIAGVNIDVVPILYVGLFDTMSVNEQIKRLRRCGSVAAPGFMNPEGVIVFHQAGQHSFKVTLEGDEAPKSVTGL